LKIEHRGTKHLPWWWGCVHHNHCGSEFTLSKADADIVKEVQSSDQRDGPRIEVKCPVCGEKATFFKSDINRCPERDSKYEGIGWGGYDR
jgi:hypothetical protein